MFGNTAVIFDMDGVLVETEPIYVDICQQIFLQSGAEISSRRLLEYVGIPAHRMWSELRNEFRLGYSVDELMRQEKTAQHKRFAGMNTIPMVSGITLLIERLHRSGIAMGVASSSSRDIIRIILTKTELHPYFDAVISGEDVKQGKPAPDIFLAACAALNRKPIDCIVIEDSPHGVAGAKQAGMKAVGFANTNSGGHDLSRADLVIDGFTSTQIGKIFMLLESNNSS